MKPKTRLLLPMLCFLSLAWYAGCYFGPPESFQTCEKCGSTRSIKGSITRRETITYESPGFAKCSHKWIPGISSAVTPPIPDDTIVLVKQGAVYGAFVPRNQRTVPETLEYDWYYRTDGKGVFHGTEAGDFQTGTGRGSPIQFGPFAGRFSIPWSGAKSGKGYIYYSGFAGTPIGPDDVRICVTGETDIAAVDATDSKWVYKGSPSDPGQRLGEKK